MVNIVYNNNNNNNNNKGRQNFSSGIGETASLS
jgi:hypothetical protein